MPKLPKLPIGIQAFETIRENGYLYVDKTEYIHRMADEGIFYFLARLRRFGKSLLVSTLKCLFEGRRELFQGLWIREKTKWEWKRYPILTIDFNSISCDTPKNLRKGLRKKLEMTAKEHNVQIETDLIKEAFAQLILEIHKKTGMPLVVLVDEYDKPIIDHLGKGESFHDIAKENRDILKTFFGVLKDTSVSSVLRFVFFTGISKFSRVSIFSELNNLDDITMSRHYSVICGYTPEELEFFFKDFIKRLAREHQWEEKALVSKLALQYDGYRFSKKKSKVYNPFSVLKAFHHLELDDYWFETGTPTFLVNLLKRKKYNLPSMEKMKVTESTFSMYDIDDLKPEALLFQSGYLTIKDISKRLYTLGYPNLEVKNAFLEHLLYSWIETTGSERSQYTMLADFLNEEDLESFFNTVSAIFESIPYTLETKRDEAYFHNLFYLMLSASGADARTEVLTCKGRIDMVVEFTDKVYIIEFKCDLSTAKGLNQIRKKGYAKPYVGTKKKIMLMSINFSSTERNIAQWDVAEP